MPTESIYFTKEQHEQINNEAKRRKTSFAAVIKDCVQVSLKPPAGAK